MNSLDETATEIYAITKDKGFWDSFTEYDPFPFYAYKLAMIHSEVTEILEALRKDKGEEEVVLEIADVLIRLLDLFEGLKDQSEIAHGWSLDKIMDEKIAFNRKRDKKHGVRG